MRIGLTFTERSVDKPNRRSAANEPSVSPADSLGVDDQEEEFDSPETIELIGAAIASHGHDVELLGDGEPMLRRLLDGRRPDLVFNFAEGRGGGRSREARVPAILETLGIPYVGSDPLTLAVTLDKEVGKRLVSTAGVAIAPGVLVERRVEDVDAQLLELKMPAIVKPAHEGSSKGIVSTSLVTTHEDLPQVIGQFARAYRQPILVEEYIEGDELTVGVVGNDEPDVIGIMRVLPRTPSDRPFLYDLQSKRDWRTMLIYECPARIPPLDLERVREATLACWKALGCRDFGRFDFRLRDGVPYFLECNPLPGLNPQSGDMCILARGMGIDHADLIGRILDAANRRLNLDVSFASERGSRRPSKSRGR